MTWRDCFSGWQNPFLPEGEADYYAWPLLTDVFPWQHSGVQLKRSWPVAESKDILERRWETFLSAQATKRAELFRETGSLKVSGATKIWTARERPRWPPFRETPRSLR